MANKKTEDEGKTINQKSMDDLKSKDRIALFISLIFVLALGLFGYQYFNSTQINFSSIKNIKQGLIQSSGEIISSSTTRTEEEVTEELEVIADGITKDGVVIQPDTARIVQPASETESVFGQWIANDYEAGEVSTGNYTVRAGDTLWELADGAYGNGAEWTKIRDANPNSIEYLPTGQQALIYAGQNLAIPN